MKPIGEGNHMPDNGPPEHWEWPEDNSGQYCKNNAYSSGNCDAEGHVCKWYLRWFRLLFVRGSLSFNLIFYLHRPRDSRRARARCLLLVLRVCFAVTLGSSLFGLVFRWAESVRALKVSRSKLSWAFTRPQIFIIYHYYTQWVKTNSSAVAKRSRDVSCLSLVSFNGTKRRVESLLLLVT